MAILETRLISQGPVFLLPWVWDEDYICIFQPWDIIPYQLKQGHWSRWETFLVLLDLGT